MYKKIFITCFIAFMSFTSVYSQAENYRMIKVDLGGLYAVPSGDFDAGLGFYIEPKFNITDNIAVGIRYESAFLVYVSPFANESKVAALNSWAITGDYYIGTNSFRPFAGLAIGTFKLADIEVGNTGFKVESDSKIGFTPRIGFLAGHFRMALAYNLVSDNNYLAIKLGWEIGGGAK